MRRERIQGTEAWLLAVLVGLGTLALVRYAGGLLSEPATGEPFWWPLAGIGPAVLVFTPRRLWPFAVGGLAAGQLAAFAVSDLDSRSVAGFTAGLAQSLLVAALLRPRSSSDESLMDAVRVLACVFTGVAVASVVYTVIGATGGSPPAGLWASFVRNQVVALLLVSPCLAVHIDARDFVEQTRERARNLEWFAQLGVTAALTGLLFLTDQGLIPTSVLALPLIWGALRLGPLRATGTLMLVALVAAVGTVHGLGRIAVVDRFGDEMATLQINLGILALTTMVSVVAGRVRERAMGLVRERTRDLNTAERMAGLGSARWDLDGGRVVWSDGLYPVLGYTPGRVEATSANYLLAVHPDDRAQVLEAMRVIAGEDRPISTRYRIIRPDGAVRDVFTQVALDVGRSGAGRRVFATIQDVTESRAAAAEVVRAHGEVTAILNAVTGAAIMGSDREDAKITFFNRGAEKMFGYSSDEVIGRLTPFDMHDPAELERLGAAGIRLDESMRDAVERDGMDTRQWTFIRKDGTTFPGQLSLSPMTRTSSGYGGFIGVITDLSPVFATQEELAESQNRFRLAFDTAPMGMAMISLLPGEAGTFLRVNEAFCDFVGLPAHGVLQARVGDLIDDAGQSGDAVMNLADLVSGRVDSLVTERRIRRLDGEVRWGRVSSSAVRPDGGRDPYLILLVEDITARKELTEQLQHEAAHDSLTGLPNRLHLHRQLDRELRERRAEAVAVLYLDLDGFKKVSDFWGHGAGDELLIQVADRIASCVRSTDVVARLGGDEFAVLCPSVPDAETALRIGRSVLASLSREYDLSETRATVSASIGVAIARHGETGPDLLHAADQAMYAAKRSGKGTVRLRER